MTPSFQPGPLTPPALGARGRLALGAACVLYCAAVALLLPSAAVATHRVPQASALYAITILIVHGLTALLLGFQYRGGGGRAVRILVAAYAYSAVHALLHTLTYPGALVPDVPLIGHGQTVGWLFLAWQLGFTLLLTSAIGVELFGGAAQDRSSAPRGGLRSVLALVCAVPAATYAAAEVLPLPVYFQGDRFFWFANATTAATAVGVAAGLAMLAALPRARSALYPWLALALLATLGGLVLSTTGGGRYTVGWYAARVSYTVGGAAVLALLLAQIARMQQSLVHSVASLAQQTQSLQAEMQKREATEMMLVQSQKMEVVGRLAGGIAHDFNNFLHVVSMRLDLLQHRLRGQDLDDDLAIIRRGVRRVEALIQHLLSFSGRKRFQPEVIVLNEWLPECVAFIQATLGARVQVRHTLDQQALAVTGNPSELEAAVLNLVLNARDALEDQGEIHVRAGLRTLSASHHPELAPGAYVELTVADNGSGIAPEHLARVFDPFFTTKPVGKGSGLGLPQVRGFATRQGGTVDIDSALGQGTTVRLLLPAAGGAAGTGAHDSARVLPGATVLLVDDSETVLEASRALLEQLGFVVVTAASADEALALLAQQVVAPGVVLSDIVMPGTLDGIGLARAVRARWPELPVILATGFSLDEDATLGAGFAVLRKPYTLDQLRQALHTDPARPATVA